MPETKPVPSPCPVAEPRWLNSWERCGLILLGIVVILFGGLVELRSALLRRRMGDLDVFLRAAWAVRAGEDIYAVTSSNGFHYHYPPLFAILLTPLADPPAGADRAWILPYPTAVAVWYFLSMLCLAAAVHGLASALEQSSPDPAVRNQLLGCWRWWALRVVPFLACVPAVGGSLMRGQVDALLLFLLCGMIAAFLRGRSWQAGLCLAAAISLKVIPAFLLLYPLRQRDWRCLSACALGLAVGLGVIPAGVFGPARAWSYLEEWAEVLVRPALTQGGDQSRALELTDVPSTDSQSLLAILHNTLYLDRSTRPRQPSDGVRLAHWSIGVILTGLLFWAARQRPACDGPGTVVLLGSLVMLMLLLSPVCHLHYFCLAIPLVMGLLALDQQSGAILRLSSPMKVLLLLNLLANALPRIPGLDVLRDLGIAGHAGLVLTLVGIAVLWKQFPRGRLPVVDGVDASRAAA
jgi:hypothetical protein